MASTLANYIDRGTTETIQSPLRSAYGAAFFAFGAGGDFVYHFTRNWSSTFTSAALDYLVVAIFLGMALERGYFLARAIRRLRDEGPSAAY
jgi:hypothetical protein